MTTACAPLKNVSAPVLVSPVGEYTNDQRRTLYTYDRDPVGKSACVGKCAEVWVPFPVGPQEVDGRDFVINTRESGERQWAVRGKATYTYSGDKADFDTRGSGVDGAWRVLRNPDWISINR